MNLMMRLFREEEGQGMTEYALILGIISIAAIAALVLLKPQIVNAFTKVTTALTGL